MNYKLLVLDLDGTLTNNKKEITEHTLRTLIAAQEKGVKIVLASGRPTYGIAPIAEKLQMKKYGGYILSYNGGEIIDWQTGEMMYENVLEDEVLPYLYQCAKDNGFAIVTYKDKYVLTEHPHDEYVQKEAILNVMEAKKVDHFLEAIDFPVPKCLIVGEATRLAELEKEMYNELKDRMGVYRSEPYFLELVPKGIDKANTWGATNSVSVGASASLTAANVQALIGLLNAGYDRNAKFAMSKKTLFTDFMPLQNNSKNSIVTVQGNAYFVYGYPVLLSDYVADHEAFLGDFKKVCANLAENIGVKNAYDINTNSYKYSGIAIFDCQPAIGEAIVKLVKASAGA